MTNKHINLLIWLLLSLHVTYGDSSSGSSQSAEQPCPICPTCICTTQLPTVNPVTSKPTNIPTNIPTNTPTNIPTNTPTNIPTNVPTTNPLPCTKVSFHTDPCEIGQSKLITIEAGISTNYCFVAGHENNVVNVIIFSKRTDSNDIVRFTLNTDQSVMANEFTLNKNTDSYSHACTLVQNGFCENVWFVATNEGDESVDFVVRCITHG
eukprot:190420_1